MSPSYEQRAKALRAPKGSALAQARINAHASFDQLWKSGLMSRNKAYRWLAKETGIPTKDCHIGFFDEDTCDKVRRLADQRVFAEIVDL